MYKVTYEPKCLNELEKEYGTLEQFDVAFAQTRYSLERNPHAFKMSPDYPQWIVIITRRFSPEGRTIPSLRMYGAIDEENKKVKIFHVSIDRNDLKYRM
jgi:hypothetical protein